MINNNNNNNNNNNDDDDDNNNNNKYISFVTSKFKKNSSTLHSKFIFRNLMIYGIVFRSRLPLFLIFNFLRLLRLQNIPFVFVQSKNCDTN